MAEEIKPAEGGNTTDQSSQTASPPKKENDTKSKKTDDVKAVENSDKPKADLPDEALAKSGALDKKVTTEKKAEDKKSVKKEDKKDDKASSGQGFSPMKRRKRTSEYGQQLSEKQLAKKIYGVRERQFRNYYKEAFRQQGDTGDILRQLLQMRLDNIIYQSGLAKTTRAARQMVSHNYFLVNGQKVNIPSYQVKIKDVITVKPEKEGKKIWDEEAKERIEEKDVPGWLALDKKTKTLKVTAKPIGDELNQEFNTRSIVEFYSR